MSTLEKIENIKTEIELLKNSLPSVARSMPAFNKANSLMVSLIEIAEKQQIEILELENLIDLSVE